jgi:pyruvate/2-oxoglutarate dehydrogenase complex dihydrolipoamide acyltransferase (E2) component
MNLESLIRRRLVELGASLFVLFGGAAVAAPQAMALGVLPPANPATDCDQSSSVSGTWNLASVDACRSNEGVGPVALPTNWSSLSPTEQGFVLINLERVNRGIAPIIGLSASLNTFATRGAVAQDDPPFPSTGDGGGIWAGASSIFAADTMWMYDDGPGGFDANSDCTSGSGCWGHRDIILGKDGGGTLVAGGGFYGGGGGGSYSYLIMSHYSTADLTFSWASELKYFTGKPGTEPVGSAAAARAEADAADAAQQEAKKTPHKRVHAKPHKRVHATPHKRVHATPHKRVHAKPHKRVHATPHKRVHAKPHKRVHAKPHKRVHAKPHKRVHAKPHKRVHAKPHKTARRHHHRTTHGSDQITISFA